MNYEQLVNQAVAAAQSAKQYASQATEAKSAVEALVVKINDQQITELNNIKQDIKQALINKGQNPTDSFQTYPQLIQNIETGSDVDFTQTTATVQTVLAGKKFFDTTGTISIGTMADNTQKPYQQSQNNVIIPKGYNPGATISIPKTDLSFVTASSSQILAGYVGADTNGSPVNGSIQHKYSSDVILNQEGSISIPKGYYQGAEVTLPQSTTTVASNQVTTTVGWSKGQATTVGTLIEGGQINPTTTDQTIAKNSFLASDIVVKGQQNFTQENIAQGVTMWGKTGTHKSGADFSGTTATAEDVLEGKYFRKSDGSLTEGVIPTVEPVLNGNVFTVEQGYVTEETSKTVPLANITETADKVTIDVGYINQKKQYYLGTQQPGNAVGVLIDDGTGGLKVQKLNFDGTVANDDSEPITAQNFYIFNTGKAEPDYGSCEQPAGSAMEVYKCAEVVEASEGNGYFRVACSDYYASDRYASGDYYLEDESQTGSNRVFKIQSELDVHYVIKFEQGYWVLQKQLSQTYLMRAASTQSGAETMSQIAGLSWESNPHSPGGATIYMTITAIPSETLWSGYLYNIETKQFSDTLTEGLEYKITAPTIGKIYNADATMLIDLQIPSGLVFYAPFNTIKNTDETGGIMSGDIQITEFQGITCLNLDGYGITVTSPKIPVGNAPRTLSYMMHISRVPSLGELESQIFYIMAFGPQTSPVKAGIEFSEEFNGIYSQIANIRVKSGYKEDLESDFMHVAISYDGTFMRIFKNGIQNVSAKHIKIPVDSDGTFVIGKNLNDEQHFYGHLAEVKVWNRALSKEEIKAEADRCYALITE